jgi:hypothetical protein
MQKLLEKGKWEHQNKDGWMKLMEMQNLDKNMVGSGFRWRRVEETHNRSRDFMDCRADGSDDCRIFGQE